jgi:hypothetical protein
MKLFGVRYIFKIFFPRERKIKWLPAVRYGYVGSMRCWRGHDRNIAAVDENYNYTHDKCERCGYVQPTLLEKNT